VENCDVVNLCAIRRKLKREMVDFSTKANFFRNSLDQESRVCEPYSSALNKHGGKFTSTVKNRNDGLIHQEYSSTLLQLDFY